MSDGASPSSSSGLPDGSGEQTPLPGAPDAADTAGAQGHLAAAGEDRSRLYPRVTSFRFRRGSLTPGQERNWERLWPELGQDLATGLDRIPQPQVDLDELFGRSGPKVLEIGSGTGISTAAMAAEEPDVDVLAVEVYKPGLAQLLGLVDRNGLTNIRMVRGDAMVVLNELIGTETLTGIRVFFPDPWRKARHHKRRLLQSGTVELMADRLMPGGILHIATDHADYAEWIAEVLATQDPSRPHVIPLTRRPAPILLERPTTKFEGRAEREGREVNEFVYVKPHPRKSQTTEHSDADRAGEETDDE